MIRILTALLLGLVLIQPPSPAHAVDILALNRLVDQTNFLVGNGCSGTKVHKQYVLTNHHCIRGQVRTIKEKRTGPDGEVTTVEIERLEDVKIERKDYRGFRRVGSVTYETEIVAKDDDLDLALLRILSDNVPETVISKLLPGHGDVRRGERVYAVGNPLGLDATLTSGIVSSTNRKIFVNGEDRHYIQVDAPINPGNSGGALYDEALNLVGIPAATVRGADGLGMAIPASVIRSFLDENCFAEVYNSDAQSHDDCVAAKEAEEEDDE